MGQLRKRRNSFDAKVYREGRVATDHGRINQSINQWSDERGKRQVALLSALFVLVLIDLRDVQLTPIRCY